MLKIFLKTLYVAQVLLLMDMIGCGSMRKNDIICNDLFYSGNVFAEIDAEKAHELLMFYSDSIIIIDVRPSDEFDLFRIEGAVNVNYYGEDFQDSIDVFPREEIYLVYCKYGARSFSAAMKMKDMGFVKLINLSGGITAWIEMGYDLK
ncbi:rhodanese-like domain-containing protein [candidate division WOR-3 bacterium]|nr:rhodanese-like domain-containing protein [candidate division WOR-3 bacterium]